VSSIYDLPNLRRRLYATSRGTRVHVGAVLPGLARSHGYSQKQLEKATGIGHSTMSGYWSGRRPLGEKNGKKIAAALGVPLSELGLTDPQDLQADPLIAQAEALLHELRRRLAPGTDQPDGAAESEAP